MQFHVSGLLREPVGAARTYTLDRDPPVHDGFVKLTRTPGAVLVSVKAAVIIDTACSRCLAPFGYRAELEFEEEFFQQVDVVTGTRLSANERADGDSFLIGLDHIVDITEAVRQYGEMATAMQPLCRPDCPGLCLGCGRDLGLEACACDGPPIESRWSRLAELKQSRDGQ